MQTRLPVFISGYLDSVLDFLLDNLEAQLERQQILLKEMQGRPLTEDDVLKNLRIIDSLDDESDSLCEKRSSFQELMHLGQNISDYMEGQEAYNRSCIEEHMRHIAGIKDLIGKVSGRDFPAILEFLQQEITVESESNAWVEKEFERAGYEEGSRWRIKRCSNVELLQLIARVIETKIPKVSN
jgi:hypothetical protein